jgi:hypothetical protein
MRSPSLPLAGGTVALPPATAENASRPARGSVAANRRSHGTAEPARRQAGWLARLNDWFARQPERDRDAWLAGAKDDFELETRIRDLGRDTPARYY